MWIRIRYPLNVLKRLYTTGWIMNEDLLIPQMSMRLCERIAELELGNDWSAHL